MNEMRPIEGEYARNRSEAEPPAPGQDIDPALEQRRRRTARLLGLVALGAVAILVAIGAVGHADRTAAAMQALNAQREAVPIVRTVVAHAVTSAREVDLPGTMQAFDSATLYARATGYISQRNVDIGSRVKKGDVLAVIAAPDLDQQLAQARAQLAQTQAAVIQAAANRQLAVATNARTARLVTEGWSSAQQGDNDRLTLAGRIAALQVANANLLAAQAQLDRLLQLTGFEKVVAPFDGVITSRQIDVGSLVTADAAVGTPLFSIARTDVLRVQVYVPQEDFFGLKNGEDAQVTVPELPGQVFHGKVARNANALQPQTRTVLAEVDVDNSAGVLTAGLYGIVHLQEPRARPVVVLPSTAVIFDKDGLSAAVYRNGTAELHHLDLQADDGAQVEVRAGIDPGERIILNPPIGVENGMRVQLAPGPRQG